MVLSEDNRKLKKNQIKVLGLIHVAFDEYKDHNGQLYRWDNAIGQFVKKTDNDNTEDSYKTNGQYDFKTNFPIDDIVDSLLSLGYKAKVIESQGVRFIKILGPVIYDKLISDMEFIGFRKKEFTVAEDEGNYFIKINLYNVEVKEMNLVKCLKDKNYSELKEYINGRVDEKVRTLIDAKKTEYLNSIRAPKQPE